MPEFDPNDDASKSNCKESKEIPFRPQEKKMMDNMREKAKSQTSMHDLCFTRLVSSIPWE